MYALKNMFVRSASGRKNPSRGFTLIEILVVIGMISILAAVVLIAINPLRQFAQARNSQRISNVNAILNAIGNRMAENKGIFTDVNNCTLQIPSTTTDIGNENTNQFDIRPCLVPTYISELPYDPKSGENTCTTASCNSPDENYDSHYTVTADSINHRITVCAPGAAEPDIPDSQAYCLTR